MQFNHQNSTIPDVYRVSENSLPNLLKCRNYLVISQNENGDFQVYFSHDDDELTTLLVAVIKHSRLLAMFKTVVQIAQKMIKKPEDRKTFKLANSMCEFFKKTYRLTKKV